MVEVKDIVAEYGDGSSDPVMCFSYIPNENIEVHIVHYEDDGIATIECECGMEFLVIKNRELAGELARERVKDNATYSIEEAKCYIGEDVLCSWALGIPAGPGSTWVSSLDEWLDLFLDCPEEELAGYDGEEQEILMVSQSLVDELGFIPEVAYRWN